MLDHGIEAIPSLANNVRNVRFIVTGGWDYAKLGTEECSMGHTPHGVEATARVGISSSKAPTLSRRIVWHDKVPAWTWN